MSEIHSQSGISRTEILNSIAHIFKQIIPEFEPIKEKLIFQWLRRKYFINWGSNGSTKLFDAMVLNKTAEELAASTLVNLKQMKFESYEEFVEDIDVPIVTEEDEIESQELYLDELYEPPEPTADSVSEDILAEILKDPPHKQLYDEYLKLYQYMIAKWQRLDDPEYEGEESNCEMSESHS